MVEQHIHVCVVSNYSCSYRTKAKKIQINAPSGQNNSSEVGPSKEHVTETLMSYRRPLKGIVGGGNSITTKAVDEPGAEINVIMTT